MALQSAAISFSPATAATAPRSIITRTRTAGGAVRVFSPGNQGGTRTSLRLLCRSTPTGKKWWSPQLRPEDLVEPTGRGAEEVEAIQDALVWEPLKPIWLAAQEIVATRGNLFRCRCFHAGIVAGPLLLVGGLCQLYRVAPNLFMDIVLAYLFYKLSVLAADLNRRGKDNTICARIQCALIVILFHKCNNPTKDFYYHFTEFIWANAFDVYSCTVFYECCGVKYPRHVLEAVFKKMLEIIGRPIMALKLKFDETK